jgi:hypothetical protein
VVRKIYRREGGYGNMKKVIIELEDSDKETLLQVISTLPGLNPRTQKDYLLQKIAEDKRILEEGKTNNDE